KAKAAIKDSSRVLGYPFAMGDRITKAMPPAVMGKDIPLGGIFDPQHPRYPEAVEFRQLYESEADVKRVVDTARGLEGLIRRPGPMGANSHTNYALRKNGQQEIIPIHPELEEPLAEILGPTYGLIVYQEQVQRAAQKLAGYSLGQADLLRRAMGKKKKEVLDKEYVPFEAGMKERGYSAGAIKTLWDILVPFADYAFNRAHSAGYGLVSYWTALLKANYPAEYMAALLTSVKDNRDSSALYLHECRRMGIKVLPPDVNESDLNFTPRGTDIRFG